MTAPDHMEVGDLLSFDVESITLDGVLQPGVVVEYDIPEGWLRRYVTDEKGHIVIDGDDIKVERVEGVVEVKMRERV